MSNEPSKDPLPYRKDLRKKMEVEDENTEKTIEKLDESDK